MIRGHINIQISVKDVFKLSPHKTHVDEDDQIVNYEVSFNHNLRGIQVNSIRVEAKDAITAIEKANEKLIYNLNVTTIEEGK